MRESNKVSSASRLILPLHREQIILRSEFIQIQILLWDIIPARVACKPAYSRE